MIEKKVIENFNKSLSHYQFNTQEIAVKTITTVVNLDKHQRDIVYVT